MFTEAALGQPRPAKPGETPPPSTRRWVRLAAGRDTTTFALADTLTVVPTSVFAGRRAVAYGERADRYRWVRPAPAADRSGGAARADSLLVCYRVLPLAG